MSRNKKLIAWMRESIPNHQVEANILKTDIPPKLALYTGSIFLLTSRYEWFSLSLIEGMSQGLIPISFPIGVAPEIIQDWENGYIITTLQEAEEKIIFLIKNTELRKKLSIQARKTAEQFKSEILAQKMMALYENIRKK